VVWSYSNSDDTATPILKPHGSINWNDYLRKNLRAGYGGWRPIDREGIHPDLRYMLFPGDPEIAKEDADIRLIWEWTAKAIVERETIIFIGYSLPEYDSFSLEFFSRLAEGKLVEVYNPSKEHLEKFRCVFGDRAILKPLRFEDCKYAKSP
jgi:hypothetical protein